VFSEFGKVELLNSSHKVEFCQSSDVGESNASFIWEIAIIEIVMIQMNVDIITCALNLMIAALRLLFLVEISSFSPSLDRDILARCLRTWYFPHSFST